MSKIKYVGVLPKNTDVFIYKQVVIVYLISTV